MATRLVGYELFLIVVILGAVAWFVIEIVLLVKKKWYKALTAVLIVAICLFSFLNIYASTASFAYNRKPLPKEIYTEFSSDDVTKEEAIEIAEYVVKQVNADYNATKHDENGDIVFPYTFREMSKRLAEEYKRIDDSYFSSYTPKAKKIINKTIMSELGITGVFFAPFGEANINGIETGLFLPYTMGHELAHGKGVMREYEADIVSCYVCLTSSDPYIRYGALVHCMYRAISMVSLYPDTNEKVAELYNSIQPDIVKEWQRDSEKWAKYDLLDKIGEFFNDLYLKLNGQSGTDSYTKPGDSIITDGKDEEGDPIVYVVNFSDMQNLLITLNRQGKLIAAES